MTTTSDLKTRIARGIHLDGPGDLLDQLRATSLALPPHCVITGVTAGTVHRLWLPTDVDPRIEIAHTATGRGRQMSRTTRPELIGCRRQLTELDVVEVEGVRVTSVARTWRDLAARLRLVELVAAGDSALRAGVSEAELADVVRRCRGRRGSANARAALALLDARSRSRPESHLRFELRVDGWPPFEVNTPILDEHGGWLAEPDLSNAQYGIAIEYQGSDHAELERMRRDLTRATCITGDRWQVLGVGPAETFTHPDRARLAVRQMLLRAGWRPDPRPSSASGDLRR